MNIIVFFNFLRVFYKSFIFKFRFSFTRINYGDCIRVAIVLEYFFHLNYEHLSHIHTLTQKSTHERWEQIPIFIIRGEIIVVYRELG